MQILSLEHEIFPHKVIIYCVPHNQVCCIHQARWRKHGQWVCSLCVVVAPPGLQVCLCWSHEELATGRVQVPLCKATVGLRAGNSSTTQGEQSEATPPFHAEMGLVID